MGFLDLQYNNICDCQARKHAYHKDTYIENYSSLFEYSKNIKSNPIRKVDILVITEKKEIDYIFQLNKILDKILNEFTYEIINSVNCAVNSKHNNDSIAPFLSCKKYHVKDLINKYNPDVIITVGKSIYSITEKKTLRYDHFYSLNKDDKYFYTSEFDSFIVPIPPLWEFMIGKIPDKKSRKYKVLDIYETDFTYKQIELAKSFIGKKQRVKKLKYEEIDDPNTFLKELSNNKDIHDIAIDIETTGLLWYKDKIHNLSLSYDGIKGYYLDWKKINKRILVKFFNSGKNYIFHNSQFDVKMLKFNRINNAHCTFDTMLASHAINENSPNGLKPLVWLYTPYGGYDKEIDKYKQEEKITDYSKIEHSLLVKYAVYDAILTYQLKKYFDKRFDNDPISKENFYNINMRVLPSIINMEMTGFKIDYDYIEKYVNDLKIKAKEIEKEIYEYNDGKELNLSSNQQVTKLFKKLGIKPKQDKTGNLALTIDGSYKLDKEMLKAYSKDYAFASKLLEYNHIMKEISQIGYDNEVINIPLFSKEDDKEKGLMRFVYNGRIYGNYNLHGTVTARLSSQSPNLQNFPKTKDFRKIIIPEEGYILSEFDFSMAEIRIYSQEAGKGVFEKLINEGLDIHSYTGTQVFNLLGENISYDDYVKGIENKEEKFTKHRKLMKGVNFGILFGIQKYGLVFNLGVDVEQADLFIKAFYKAYPEIQKFMDRQLDKATKYGYVTSLLGWVRNLPWMTYIGKDSYSTKLYKEGRNSSFNSPVQSLNGQNTLLALADIHDFLQENNCMTKIIANVHDSIVFEMHKSEVEFLAPKIKEIMEKVRYNNYEDKNVSKSSVVHEADGEFGDVWGFGESLDEYLENNKKELTV